jgi:hypothetical protein
MCNRYRQLEEALTLAKAFNAPLLACILLMLGACGGDSRPPPGSEGTLVTSLSQITGPWDIVHFGGYRPSRLDPSGIRRAYVNISPKGLSYTIECNYSGNPGRIDANGILHDETKDESRFTTLAGCGPEGDAREGAFYGFFSSEPKVSWLSGGRVKLTGRHAELVLERPEQRRLANMPSPQELNRSWVPSMATRVDKNGGYSGGGFQQPGLLKFGPGHLTYSNCGGIALDYTLAKDGRMMTSGKLEEADCGRDSGDRMLFRVLERDPFVERTAEGGVALTAGEDVISLRTEEEARRYGTYPPAPPSPVRQPVQQQPPLPPTRR